MGSPIKGRADHYVKGDWNAVCSMCGRKRKASTLVQNWQGQWRCPEHNEARQPQDFVRGVPDIIAPPWIQDPESLYIEICTFDSISAIPDEGGPGCMIPGRSIWSQGGGSVAPPIVPVPPIDTTHIWTTDTGAFWEVTPNVYWTTI